MTRTRMPENLQKSTVVFAHHPCPDGIAAIVSLTDKFDMKSTTYHGLNHANPENMRKIIFSAIEFQPKHIIFVDIIPPIAILKELLEKKTCDITLLDHHETGIHELNAHEEPLKKYASRLHKVLDLTRSGAGIAYDYIHRGKNKPIYIELVQAMDQFTATANTDFIKPLDAKKCALDSKSQEKLLKLGAYSKNKQISSFIEFYVFAAIVDLQLKQFYNEHNYKINNDLIEVVKKYLKSIEENGIASLLHTDNIETIFREQLDYQIKSIENAKIVPSFIREDLDVLFIDADIMTGRTFDALISQTLASLNRPTIAMIANTKKISDADNWVALRAANDKFNLYKIASEYKKMKLADNAGGHARASALQLNRAQLTRFIDVEKRQKISPHAVLNMFSRIPEPASGMDFKMVSNDEINNNFDIFVLKNDP